MVWEVSTRRTKGRETRISVDSKTIVWVNDTVFYRGNLYYVGSRLIKKSDIVTYGLVELEEVEELRARTAIARGENYPVVEDAVAGDLS